MPRNNNIQFRKGSRSEWTTSNPVLNSGEPGFESDSNRLKIGLGLNWDDTSYISADSLLTTVYNKTGSTISGFNVVYISGGHGNLPAISPSIATADSTSANTYGVTVGNIDTNSSGLVITNGLLKNVNTNQFGTNKEGSSLWLSPTVSGGLTLSKPYAPYHGVFIGTIVRSSNTHGVVEVKIQNGYELEELHDVAVTGVTNGQFLQYNTASGLWLSSSSGNFTTLQLNGTGVVASAGGTSNYISKFNNSNTITNSIIYDNGTNVGIGTINPSKKLEVNGATNINGDLTVSGITSIGNSRFYLNNDTINNEFTIYRGNVANSPPLSKLTIIPSGNNYGVSTKIISNPNGTQNIFLPSNDGTVALLSDINTSQITGVLPVNKGGTNQSVYNNGQLLIGSGTSLAANTLTAGTGISITNGSGTITIDSNIANPVTGTGIASHIAYWNSSSGISADSGQLYWDATNNRLGIGTEAPTGTLDVNGDVYIRSSNNTIISIPDYSDPASTLSHRWFNTYSDLNTDIAAIGIGTDSSPLNGELAFFTHNGTSLTEKLRLKYNGNFGIGTNSPSSKLDVNGSANISSNLTIGGNLTVNGSVVTANVDRMEIEDPIITLGLASGNIVTTDTLDRGLALIRGTGLTAFMGWDTSASQFVMLSSGVASNSSGTYTPGTYGNLRINDLVCNTGNFNGIIVGGPARFSVGAGGFGFQIDRGNIDPGFNGDILKFDVNDSNGVGYSTTLMSDAPGYDIIVKLPADSGTLARLSDINTSQITGILSVAKGGTNRSTYSNGQLLIGSGTSLAANTLTAGTGISITNGSGTIRIDSNIVNPVTGTGVANHIAYWNSSSGIIADSGQLYWDAIDNRLGIGTSNPQELIHISGSIAASTGNLLRLNNSNSTANPSINFRIGGVGNYDNHFFISRNGTDVFGIDTNNRGLFLASFYLNGNQQFLSYNNANASIKLQNTTTNNLEISAVSGILFQSQLSTKMTMDKDGNFGIGTSSPSTKLHVSSTSNNDTTLEYTNSTAGFNSGVIPLKLLLTGSNGVAVGAGVGLDFVTKSSSTEYIGGRIQTNRTDTSNNHALTFWAGGGTTALTEYMRIASNGNVGIGTTNPGYKLQVSGGFGATTKSFRIDHPSKKGWNLEYGSLESPYHGVRLTGRGKVVKGVGTVDLPDYLKDLIHDDESIVIQLTNYKHSKTLYVDSVDLQNDKFVVKADRAKTLGELEFFWTLTGIRKDVENLVVEKEN